jgi:type II secretory pathway predicted ATPase ExeA
MPRFFNTAGPCDPARHYVLPTERRLPEARGLIDRQSYFVLHAPRQSGKTTLVRTLAQRLTAEGRYSAVYATCEQAATTGADLDRGIAAVLYAIADEMNQLPSELRPRAAEEIRDVPAENRLAAYLTDWSEQSPRPTVLFLDEIDALRDETLLSVLRQLRARYPERPRYFPSSVVLVGQRDTREPFNVKSRSLTLANFSPAEIAELCEQHSIDTGQIITRGAVSTIWELTWGHPELVNALASAVVETVLPDRAVAIDSVHVELARQILVERTAPHLDYMRDKLLELRVQRMIEPILQRRFLPPDLLDDDLQYAKDLGLVISGPLGLELANPIYEQVFRSSLEGRP